MIQINDEIVNVVVHHVFVGYRIKMGLLKQFRE